MQEYAHGHVIRCRLLTETSLIIHWITAEHGRIATVAKGARRPKSPFHGKLDLFQESDLTFQRSRRSDLHGLRELKLRNLHLPLRQDLNRLSQAAYAVQLIERATERDHPMFEIFELFNGFICWLGASHPSPMGVLTFELKFLQELGLCPDLAHSGLPAAARDRADAWIRTPWEKLESEPPGNPPGDGETIDQWLRGELVRQWGKLPRARAGAMESR